MRMCEGVKAGHGLGIVSKVSGGFVTVLFFYTSVAGYAEVNPVLIIIFNMFHNSHFI